MVPPGVERGARAVEAAVAQGEAFDALGRRHRLLDVADRVERAAHGRDGVRVQGVGFGLHPGSVAGVGPAGVALGDEAPGARRPGGLEQVVGAFGAKPVRHREALVGVAQARQAGQRGELVDDRVRLGLDDRAHHRVVVERVEDDRLGTGLAERAGLLGRAGRADHGVAALEQDGDEPPAQGAGGARKEHLHFRSPFEWSQNARRDALPARDS